ncbi:MAG: hypothetical protein VW169_14425 [Rhodospirillaceae bacterium]
MTGHEINFEEIFKDGSIRIVWCDLKGEDRDDYLTCLQGGFLPAV